MTNGTESPLAWLAACADRYPEHPALIGQRDSLRYGELWRALGRWSRILSDAGLERARPTAIVSRSRERIARAVWLGLYMGIPVLPLDPQRVAAASLLTRCGVSQIIADGDLEVPTGLKRLPSTRLDDVSEGPLKGPEPLAPEQPQLLVTTSGTVGTPRAAMLSGANLTASAASTCAELGMAQDDAWLICLPLTHVAGLMILFRCARVGAAALVHERFDAGSTLASISASRITRLSVVPSMLHRLLDVSGERPPRRVRSVLVGGAPVPVDLARRAVASGWPLQSTYGMTETASHVALSGADPANPGLRPLPGIHIDVVDDQGAPTEGSGWVRISGPVVMVGYANQGLQPGAGLAGPSALISKDIGRLDGNGRLRLIGRGDDVINSGGLKIHPAEIEALLAGCPGVRETAITGRIDRVWGQRIVAIYAGDVSPDEFARWTGEHIESAMRPREFHRVGALPRNAMGKLDRKALVRLLGAATADRPESG